MSRGYQRTIEDRATHIEQLGPLPTAEELAAPLAAALWAIKAAFDGRANALTELREFAELAERRPDYDGRPVNVSRQRRDLNG